MPVVSGRQLASGVSAMLLSGRAYVVRRCRGPDGLRSVCACVGGLLLDRRRMLAGRDPLTSGGRMLSCFWTRRRGYCFIGDGLWKF